MAKTNELNYVQLVQLDDGTTWLFKETPKGWVKHRQIKVLYDITEGVS